MKDIVEIRPIFHRKERRVRTHIFLCILAQVVVNKIKDKLKEEGWLNEEKGNSFSHFLDVFYQSIVWIFEIEGKEEKTITRTTPEMKELLNMFDMEQRYFSNFIEVEELLEYNLKRNFPLILMLLPFEGVKLGYGQLPWLWQLEMKKDGRPEQSPTEHYSIYEASKEVTALFPLTSALHF